MTRPTKMVSRRTAIKRGAAISGALWVTPVIQSIRMPANAQGVGSPAPCVVTGFMTGSGYAFISGTSGPKVHYVTSGQLHCSPDPNDGIRVEWDNGLKSQNRVTYQFDLTAITSTDCTDNPNFEDPGPTADFNETLGSGIGTLKIDGQTQPGDATIEFDLIDGGEPGINADRVTIRIFYPGNTLLLNVDDQPLTQGNLQTHGNESFGEGCA